MPADSNSLTFILQQFLTAFQAGRGAVGVDAFHLLGILATLELTVAAIWWALVGDDVLVAPRVRLVVTVFYNPWNEREAEGDARCRSIRRS